MLIFIKRLAESTLASIVKELQKLFTSQPQGSSQIRLTSTEFTSNLRGTIGMRSY